MSTSKETKRSKSEFACAECRRLKTTCNRQVPCSTCVKRGCDVLCPDSTMPPGGGSRFVSIAEEFLRRKIAKMEERMHSLEDALVIIQGPTSHTSCPLLNENGPKGDTEWKPEVDRDSSIENEFNRYGLVEVLGTLYLDDDATLVGTSTSSECILLQAKVFVSESPSPTNHIEEIDTSYLPSEIRAFYQAFPFAPPGVSTETAKNLIESCLPLLPRATALCETFLQTMSWIIGIVSRQHILGELIPMVYQHVNTERPKQLKTYGPHDIALLFIIFALGAVVDPSLPPYNTEGQHYHILSRAALCLQPVLTQHSVTTIKTLHLMSIYNGMCGIDSKLGDSFSLLNMAAQVALQIGIHKDPSIWGISGMEAYERRMCFWDLLHKSLWQCLVTGQPPVIMHSLSNCHIPTKEEEDKYQSSGLPSGYGTWCFSFAIQCLVPVVEITQAVQSPGYDSVVALDRKIRQFSEPPTSSHGQISGEMQAIIRSQMRELTLLFLHRSFFAQALSDFPWDPSMSPHRQSFLTAYQSATQILGVSRKLFVQHPVLCARVWRIWSFAFSAAITIAAVAVKQLSIELEPKPFEQLNLACTLFREAAPMSVRAQEALPILLRLHREATRVALEARHCESGETGSVVKRDQHQGTHDSHGTSVDSSIPLVRYPASGVPYPENRFIPTPESHALPVTRLPLPKTVGPDQEPYAGSVQGTTFEWQDSYSDISSWSILGIDPTSVPTHGATHTPYGVPLEDQWTSFMNDCTEPICHVEVCSSCTHLCVRECNTMAEIFEHGRLS